MFSTAAWSSIQYLFGLGDRHLDNVLISTKTGVTCHIDFDCIFEKGKDLPTPEIVQFRLTNNIVGALGMLGT